MKMVHKLVGLFVVLALVVALLPVLRSYAAPVFPEGFRDLTCNPNSCAEGEFCQDNVCTKRGPGATEGDPDGYFS